MMHSVPLLEELETALSSGTFDRRNQILTSVTDLFINGAPHFSEDQVSVFDDVMRASDQHHRGQGARQAGGPAGADRQRTPQIVHLLASDDDIEVARPILIRSERLNEDTLLATAKSKSQRHLHAIAQRNSLSEALTEVLVERGDRNVVHSVVKNRGARFPTLASAFWSTVRPATTRWRAKSACATIFRDSIF